MHTLNTHPNNPAYADTLAPLPELDVEQHPLVAHRRALKDAALQAYNEARQPVKDTLTTLREARDALLASPPVQNDTEESVIATLTYERRLLSVNTAITDAEAELKAIMHGDLEAAVRQASALHTDAIQRIEQPILALKALMKPEHQQQGLWTSTWWNDVKTVWPNIVDIYKECGYTIRFMEFSVTPIAE